MQAERIDDEEEQKLVSGNLSEVAERDSSGMNSDDVKITSAIIDKVIEFDNNKTLGEEVRNDLTTEPSSFGIELKVFS